MALPVTPSLFRWEAFLTPMALYPHYDHLGPLTTTVTNLDCHFGVPFVPIVFQALLMERCVTLTNFTCLAYPCELYSPWMRHVPNVGWPLTNYDHLGLLINGGTSFKCHSSYAHGVLGIVHGELHDKILAFFYLIAPSSPSKSLQSMARLKSKA